MEKRAVSQAIEHWASVEPQRVAVWDNGIETTYGAFWQRVQSTAAALHALGCGREDCVAVYVARSTDAIVAIYAALACGSAFVPVDPAAGKQRISYILENCRAKAVLTAGECPETTLPILDVRNLPTMPFSPPERRPEDLAYVIYTSGTTGVPKGVMIEEHSMLNHLDTLFEHYGCHLGQKVPLMTSHCFDFSIPIVFSLYFGMTLLLFPDALAVGDYLAQERLEFLRMTPSHFMAAADHLKRTGLGKVDMMIFGGEALTDAMCAKVREVFGAQVRIFNEYGPTETTVYTTFIELHEGQTTSIGTACAGSTAYILDGERLCGVGEIGELCFAGPNVARGYFDDPERTAERFRMHNGVRLYHTGDLGYLDEEGLIYYAGRRDKQIKIRGYRVEPEEISGVLRRQEYVTDAVVIAIKAPNGEQELHAYLVADRQLDLAAVQQSIREDLPSYMIPAAMLQIERIPLTANGKLDEKALPRISRQRSHTPPRNMAEKRLCALFGELLHMDEIGIDEDFFVLGGNSLAAMRLHHRLAEEGLTLSLSEIFTKPTVQELAPLLTAQKQSSEPIPIAAPEADYPLSAPQEQMYWFYRLDPSSLSYHMPWLLRLEEGVTPESIRSAMQAMVDRHEILRTRFFEREGTARQEVLPHLQVKIRVIEEVTELTDDILRDFLKPFILEKPPLFRFTMLKQAEGWLLLTDMHHIIRDGLSCGIFIEEYIALREGRTLPETKLQYKDYCKWLEGCDLSAQGEFWLEQFRTLPQPLELPTDHPRPAVRSYDGRCVQQPLPEKLKERLRELEKQTNTTDYMIFLAGAMLLLSQYARQEDIVIGSPFAGRSHEDLGQLLGIFINTLPLRAYPEANKTLSQFLREIRTLCIGAYEHQDYPLAKLVEACGATRESSRNPLYDVILVLQNREHMDYRVDGRDVKRLPMHQGCSKVDMSFQILESRDHFDIILEYSTELFEQRTAERFLSHYLTLLEMMTTGLEKRLGELLPLTNKERNQILQLPACGESLPTVAQSFALQAVRTPDAVALRDGAREWSYAELSDKAARLAAHLSQMGLKEGDFALLLCERSAEYLVGVLAVLHCGAAFVPVDPEYPNERIEYILQDSDAVVVLTDREAPALCAPVVSLHEKMTEEPLELMVAGENSPAYMIYTSGTTGKPKGVMISNRSLSYYISYAGAHYLDLSAPMEVALFSSISFDLTITSTFLGLLNGGTTTVYRQSPDQALAQILRENRTSFLKLTPSHLKMMLELPFEGQSSLRHMILGGEALSVDLARSAQQRFGAQLCIHNEYGPTEATVGCCDYCFDEQKDREISVSIGRPMPHAQIYILRGDQLCPIGMPGELCIAGEGVAIGYRKKPELTAAVFVPNPFGKGMLYRSGDLARLCDDGRLEFMGRIDDQVKIRGYRIEPAEVQKVLAGVDGVQSALVVADVAEAMLCGYVVSEQTLDLEAIRAELARELPSYMLPHFLMQISAIPLTVNGKVDKAALPRPQRRADRRAPETHEEKLVCKLVGELLDLEDLSPEEDFFSLGGNSLKLMTLRLRLERQTGKAVSLTALYREPQLGAIALHLAETAQATRAIEKAKKQESYAMSAVQQRLYAIYLADPTGLAYNHPMGIRIRGALDLPRLEAALNELLMRHEALRTYFDGKSQYIVDDCPFTLTKRRCPNGNAQALLEAFPRAFRLEEAPLLRAELVELADEDYLLLLDVHHIAADGISKSLISRELTALYNGEALAEVELQYKDYSQWLLTDERSEGSAFWQEMCGGEPTELIYDKPSAKQIRRSAAECSLRLSAGQSDALRKLCASQGITPYMFFFGVWSCLLGAYTRSEDVTVGSSFAGRTQPNLEQTVGMFVHTLLLRSHPENELSFCEYLQKVKDLCQQAQSYQEESEAAQREALATCKLFYAFEDIPSMDFALNGTECSMLTPQNTEIPFDMTFLVEDCECYGFYLQYCTALFAERTAQQMLAHLKQMVDCVLAQPQVPIGRLPLATAEEHELLATFNQTEVKLDDNLTVAELFETRARQYADKTALIFDQQSLSYREFNAKANGIAHWLKEHGIGAGDFVALLCKNSMERMLAVWGTIKSGAAYVPMEPDFPTERIRSILDDCRPRAVLTFGAEIDTEIPVLKLEQIPQPREDDPERTLRQSDPLYCIYTSGTTGKPKGVVLSNRGLINLVNYYERRLGFTHEDRVLQFASYCFDASVSEMLMALAFGGTLLLTPEELRHDSRRLSEYCMNMGINVATFPPNLYAQMEPFPARLILTAGSAADPDTVRRGSQKGAYLNAYGPTEASICATDWLYAPQTPIPERVPIGKPIDNVQIYILQGERICGLGIAGELCIAGESLALEYLNRPELTREKFVILPQNGKRLYRTGDLARWLPDGNIEYLGRIDEQVKLRGYRIELQEISSCILALPGMEQAAVRLVEPQGQPALLCAYYVSNKSYEDDVLRKELAKLLPEYMLPTAYVAMEDLPLNHSGKIDSKRLPMPQLGARRRYLPPVTQAQETLCAIFEELLQVHGVGRDDDFFMLGGQSLKAMLLMNRIEETFGYRPGFADILEHRTVEALETLLQRERKTYTPIPKQPTVKSCPASAVQARFYSIQKAQPDSVAYNVPFCLKLEGNRSRLAAVLNEVFSLHEAFRTCFAVEDGQVVQKISEFVPLDFTERELADGESVEQALKEFVRPFCMEKAPLLRVGIVIKGEDAWLLMDMHHSIVDGVSTHVLSQQFNAIYSGKTIDEVRQYRDYSLWEAKQDKSAQKEFWSNALAGELPRTILPYETRANGDTRGALRNERISPELTQAIRELARATGTTEYMLLLTAVMVVLARYSGTEDVTVGSPVANRLHPDTAQMVGMFVNTLLMRAHPKADCSFKELLAEVREFTLQALEYQDYPFDAVVDELRSRGAYDEASFLPVMFSMQEPGKFALYGEDFRAEACEANIGEGKFDLSIDVLPEPEGYVFSMDYRCARLSENAVRRFFAHVERVLQEVTTQPEIKLSQIEILTPAERSGILDIFNHTPKHERRSYLELFARQAARTPEATAVVCKEQRLTYGQLDRMTDQLAWRLRKNGMRPGDVVAVMSHFNEDMFLSALGIMKAGCAYLPIDPAYPEQRIAYMLQDSGARAIVRSHGLTVQSDLPQNEIGREEGEAFPTEFDPAQIAYVIYTSGSTGMPKGVMVSQAALANMVQWHERYYGIKPGDRSCKYASFSFDASVHEMYPQLACGVEIHIIPEEIRMDMFAINRYLTENQINIGFLPTPICEQFVRLENHTLEKLIAGGDRMTRHSKNYTLYNNYGPTENTVVSTVYEVQGHEKNIPIGKPIDGTRVYVLSKERQLQPIGVVGELALAGSSLADGYLHKPELTAERFVDDPFFPGEKMYLSGDLGRWTEQGDLFYEGRIDNQCKIRGNRVELGEIETVAQTAEGVDDARVRVLDGRLVLYAAGTADEKTLREQLQRSLPSYMIPEAYVLVEKLKYTVNSKPDFEAMPEPQFKMGTEFVPAADPIEESLAGIWSEVLQTEPVGRNDNFFELGGNSLRITLLHYAIEKHYPGSFSVGDLFARPTVAAMAQLLREKLAAQTAPTACMLSLADGHGGSASAPADPCCREALLGALAYSLYRLGKCREAVIYYEAEEGLMQCYRFDMGNTEAASQLVTAAQEQGGAPMLSMPRKNGEYSRHAGLRKPVTVLLTSFENRAQMDLVFTARDGRICVHDNRRQISATALEQLVQLFAKACPLFVKAAESDTYPLSTQQSRIYIAQNLIREQNAYVIPMIYRLPLQTDVPRLCSALQSMVARYDIFRTSFMFEDETLSQKVAPQVDFTVQVRSDEDFDPMQLPQPEPFDLTKAPLLRAELVQARENVYLLIHTHHIILDGASLEILRREVLALYRGESLPPVGLQYPEYCRWKSDRQVDEDYWRAHFEQGVPRLELPTDLPRSKNRSYLCGVERIEMDAQTQERMHKLAAQQGTTEFSLLTAATHLLLSRFCGQKDTILGTAMSGRTQARVQNVPGMFVNTVPLTAHIDPNESFAQLLRQVSKTLAEAEEHQEYPFTDLIRLLGLETDGSSTPLIDVAISFEESSNVPYAPMELLPQVEKFDMSLCCRRSETGSTLELSYCTDLFCAQTARRLLQSLYAILQGLDPETPLKAIRAISREQESELDSYNQTDVDYDRSKTVCDSIDALADSDKAAIVFKGNTLSYRELIRQSLCVAGNLQQRGLKEQEIVGILLPRGLEMYPAIYGVLKSGGAYLPMDPDYPDARLAHMVKDSGLRYVLTCEALASRLSGLCETLIVSSLPDVSYRPMKIGPKQLAYVIYTSGSSGLPKGVLVEHGSLMNMVLWHQRRFGNCAQDVSTQYAGLGFDATVWEIFPYLAVGATIHVIPQELRLDMEALNAYYEAHGVTISFLPTQICEQFMRLDNHSLRLLHTAGDKLKRFEKRDYILMNNYGPTENTVVATTAEITEPSWNLPIGRPMENCKTYVLDDDGMLLPPGARGELCLTGDSLARGYLHRPEENERKFVPNPFGSGRMYKTGDLVRWNVRGELEFFGRNDQQVKIRGNRIECGEIEAVLSSLPKITQCAVLVERRENGEGYLLAYFCADEALEAREIKAELSKRLPEYMLPSHIIQLSELPLTANGKLDRKALPKPQEDETRLFASTPMQKALAEIWAKLLEHEPTVDRSFFAQGGTSVLLISLQRMIGEHFGKKITVAQLFANPTIQMQELLLQENGTICLHGLPLPNSFGKAGSRIAPLSAESAKVLRQMQPDRAFSLGTAAFGYLLSALSKEKRVPLQGRREQTLFAGYLDFDGISDFAQVIARAQETPMEMQSAQAAQLQVEKQAGQRVPFLVWNDAEHLTCDDRADPVVRICLREAEGTVRVDNPRDAALATALAKLLQDLTLHEGRNRHGS